MRIKSPSNPGRPRDLAAALWAVDPTMSLLAQTSIPQLGAGRRRSQRGFWPSSPRPSRGPLEATTIGTFEVSK